MGDGLGLEGLVEEGEGEEEEEEEDGGSKAMDACMLGDCLSD